MGLSNAGARHDRRQQRSEQAHQSTTKLARDVFNKNTPVAKFVVKDKQCATDLSSLDECLLRVTRGCLFQNFTQGDRLLSNAHGKLDWVERRFWRIFFGCKPVGSDNWNSDRFSSGQEAKREKASNQLSRVCLRETARDFYPWDAVE